MTRPTLGMPWPTRLVIGGCLLGILWTLGALWYQRAERQVDCEAQRTNNWASMPALMTQLQSEADARRRRLQAALDTQRAASWWAWLVLPATPADPGCQTMPF